MQARQAEYETDIPYKTANRSIPQLIRDFTRETTALVRDEVDLAKSEVTDKISQLGSGMSTLVIGALVFFAGLLVLLDAAVAALLQVIPPDQVWLAPLIVGGVVFLIGAIMLASGRSKLKAENLKPQRTLNEMHQDKTLVKEKLS